ncbi:unnamed protein product [Trichogramma brassicae]|uniref:Uncharacterized protein n=1 Tax=Trichogramma brassicae TaxID=86971 RepID=A0A6H5HUT7_9HYME|nr:unnamed protein product [Trichogramma brassicae]
MKSVIVYVYSKTTIHQTRRASIEFKCPTYTRISIIITIKDRRVASGDVGGCYYNVVKTEYLSCTVLSFNRAASYIYTPKILHDIAGALTFFIAFNLTVVVSLPVEMIVIGERRSRAMLLSRRRPQAPRRRIPARSRRRHRDPDWSIRRISVGSVCPRRRVPGAARPAKPADASSSFSGRRAEALPGSCFVPPHSGLRN